MSYTAGNFDSSHHYVQWGGKLPGGEIWSCGLRMANIGGGTIANDPAFLNSIATVVEGFHQRPESLISSRALLTFVKVNVVGVDGKYAALATQEHLSANLPGSGSSNAPANQVALAVSLLTGFSRGPAHRGRFYMPIPTVGTLDDTGLIAAGTRDTIKGSCSSFVTALNGVSANAQVAVFSRKSGAAAHRLVSSVAVGRVLDTQRRRRNKLAEAY